MRNRFGITERFWAGVPEDTKILWKLFMFAIAAIASLLISTTGVVAFDWFVKAFSTLTALVVIETQRNLRRYTSHQRRKNLIRASIRLGVSAVALLGFAFFLSVGYIIAKSFMSSNLPFISGQENKLHGILATISIAIGVAVGIFKSFRDLQFEEICYRLPLSGLKKIFITRPVVATNFPEFAFFELSVIVLAYLYSSTAAQIAQTFIDASKL